MSAQSASRCQSESMRATIGYAIDVDAGQSTLFVGRRSQQAIASAEALVPPPSSDAQANRFLGRD